MAKILTCNYELENIPELRHISPEAKMFIKNLLVLDQKQRLSASGKYLESQASLFEA
jgi:hypothetical protein